MYKEDSILVQNSKISYYEFGTGNEVILMVSGFGTPYPLLDMYNLAQKLSMHYRCIIIDRPGYGKSQITSSKRDAISFASEVTCILIKLGIDSKNVIILGHSLGAIYSLVLSQRLNLKGIALLDFEMLNKFESLQTKFMYGIYFGMCQTKLKEKYNKKLIDKMIYPVKDVPTKIKNQAISFIENSMPNRNIKSELDSIDDDLYIIKHGMKVRKQKAIMFCTNKNKKANENLKKYYSESRLITIDTNNHFVHYDNGDMIANKIIDFFEVKKDV